jgi:hypothetical protein
MKSPLTGREISQSELDKHNPYFFGYITNKNCEKISTICELIMQKEIWSDIDKYDPQDIIDFINEIKKKEDYSDIYLETSYDYDEGMDSIRIEAYGYRKETEEEYKKRLEWLEIHLVWKQIKEEKDKKKKEQNKQEQKEYKKNKIETIKKELQKLEEELKNED